jgi:hypothetical protein
MLLEMDTYVGWTGRVDESDRLIQRCDGAREVFLSLSLSFFFLVVYHDVRHASDQIGEMCCFGGGWGFMREV